jgi:peptide/nickel transport system substrate-binding protein
MNIAIGRPFASQDVAQTIVQFLRKVGVTVKINTFDWGEFLADWRKGNAPMYYMGFGTPVLDIDDFIGGYFDPKRRATWGHAPPEALDLAYQAMKAFDPETRKEIYGKFVTIIQDDAPFIFLFNFDDIYAYNKRIKGFVPRADEQIGILTLSKE